MYLKEKCLQIDGLWVCECTILDSLPKLTFMFSGVEVYIYPEEYVDNFVTNCIVHLGSINSQPEQLLLGDTLFKNYIITFDKINEQVGFNGESLAIFSYG